MTDLNEYQDFVLSTTSDESRFLGDFIERIEAMGNTAIPINPSLLLTAAIGMGSEAGEFQEIVKKLIFQGKSYNGDIREHMIRELGDVLWYVANAATALNVTFEDIVQANINKLQARYPEGFEVFRSENRDPQDL